MGQQGTKIAEVNVKEIIEDLNKAMADEWLAVHQYWAAVQFLEGIRAEEITKDLQKEIQDEMAHAEKLAQRIVQLGGRPTFNPAELLEKSNCGFKEPPENSTDVKQVIQDVLAGERCAIKAYNELAKKTFGKDPVTYNLVTAILQDEVGHEEKYEGFLKEFEE